MDDTPQSVVAGSGITPGERERIERIGGELLAGIGELGDIGPAVGVFGSARAAPDSWAYRSARALGERLASAGVTVVTGYGPGIVEAANHGARTGPGRSDGLSITLPCEQLVNPSLDVDLVFRYFFTRKFMLIRYARGFAIYPGGFGTIDELFELLTLMQTGKLARCPLVLVGDDYWSGLYNWLARHAAQAGYIDGAELDLIEIVPDEEIAADVLLERLKT